MGKFSSFLGQSLSYKGSKAATDALWATDNGTAAYRLGGKIFIVCGIGWVLLSLIPIFCGTPIREWVWMVVVAAIQIIPGTVILILSKKSKRFQKWAERDFRKGLEKKKNLEEKAKIGKVTLPMTNGDVFALKILGVLALLLVAILGIGYVRGWVV